MGAGGGPGAGALGAAVMVNSPERVRRGAGWPTGGALGAAFVVNSPERVRRGAGGGQGTGALGAAVMVNSPEKVRMGAGGGQGTGALGAAFMVNSPERVRRGAGGGQGTGALGAAPSAGLWNGPGGQSAWRGSPALSASVWRLTEGPVGVGEGFRPRQSPAAGTAPRAWDRWPGKGG